MRKRRGKLTAEQIGVVVKAYWLGQENSPGEICTRHGISRPTLSKYVREYQPEPASHLAWLDGPEGVEGAPV